MSLRCTHTYIHNPLTQMRIYKVISSSYSLASPHFYSLTLSSTLNFLILFNSKFISTRPTKVSTIPTLHTKRLRVVYVCHVYTCISCRVCVSVCIPRVRMIPIVIP